MVERHEVDLEGKTPEEILDLAHESGYELRDDELEQISGGGWGGDSKKSCHKCSSTNLIFHAAGEGGMGYYECQNCGHTFR